MLRDNEKAYIYPIIAFTSGAFLVSLLFDSNMEIRDYISPIATLFAAYIGASFAFKLNLNRETRREYLKNIESINFVMFVLIRQLNAIEGLRRHCSKYKDDYLKEFNQPAYDINEYADLKQDFSSVSFIMQTRYTNLLLELSISQEKFEQALSSIKERNLSYTEEYLPVLKDKNLNGKNYTREEMKVALGEPVYMLTTKGYEHMIEHIESCGMDLRKTFLKVRKVAINIYPDANFINWVEK